jgi:competence protein ComEC
VRFFVFGLVLGAMHLQSRAELPSSAAWAAVLLSLVMALSAIAIAWMCARIKSLGVAVTVSVLWVMAGALAAFGYAQHRAEVRLSDELSREWEGRDVEIIAAVASLPTLSERGTRFIAQVESVITPGASVPKNISLTWYAEENRKTDEKTPPPTLTPGERWQLTVRLRRPHGTSNPHGFDFEAYALERNIRATGYVRVKGVNQKLDTQARGFLVSVDRARMRIRDRMNAALGDAPDSPYRGVLVALAIGEQNAIPASQWKTFWRTGTGHLMSISGLHITMVAALLYWLGFRLWAHVPALAARIPAQRAAAVIGAATALSYSLIAGWSVPTQRTFFMLLAVAIALIAGRAISASRILAFALMVVVLLDPWSVLAPGFWLSFGAVAMIFYVTANRTGGLSIIGAATKTQIAVTLGMLPATLSMFGEVSLISPIANAFAIPVVSWIVVPLTLLGAMMPFDFLLHAAHAVMHATYAALEWFAALPDAVWQSHAPPAWAVVLAMMGVLILLLPRGVRFRWVGLVAMLPMFFVLPPKPREGEVWLTLLDVGQGLATVVRTANYTMVYDTGPKWNPDSDSGNRIVVPYLRGEGIRSLDALVVTHDDEDHTGGARSVIDMRNPKWVLTSAPAESESFTNAREVMRCEAGDSWRWDGVDFDVLHPTKEAYDETRKTNDFGCVIKITAPGGSILMTADIEKRVERELLERATSDELKADILIVPHHGSKTSSTDAFIDAVAPKVALLPVGYRNRFRHPHPSVEARYLERNIPLHRTDEAGAITVKLPAIAGSVPSIESHRKQSKHYWTDMPRPKVESSEP